MKWCSVLLFIYSISFATANNYYNNRLIFDVTEPLEDILNGNSKEEDFIKNLLVLFSFNGEDFTNRTLYYAADGKTIAELENQTLQCYKILKNAIGITSGKYILISWTTNMTTLNLLKFPSYIKAEANLEPAIIINLPDETKCLSQLESASWNTLLGHHSDDYFIGISFSESLNSCRYLENVRKRAKIVVTKIKFGDTIGVQESFGLFQNKFKFTLVNRWVQPSGQKLIYFPTPNYVGDNNHRQLFCVFANTWTTSNKTYGDFIVQGYTATNEIRSFSITPSVAKLSSRVFPQTLSWFALVATGFRRRQSLILNNLHWRSWIREIERSNEILNVLSSLDLPLDFIVDYSDYKPTSLNLSSRTWEKEENLMMRSLSYGLISTTGAKLSVIVFRLQEKEDCHLNESFCWQNDDQHMLEFAQKMAGLNVSIGCLIQPKYFALVDPVAIVSACSQLNGTMYILRYIVLYIDEPDYLVHSFSYENKVRKELNDANNLRKYLMNQQPLAKVYLEVEGRENWEKSFSDMNTLFCEQVTPKLNLYLEASINWANLENFPVILVNNFHVPHSSDISSIWFSMLRQLNIPYLEWSFDGPNENSKSDSHTNNTTAQTHPSFLIRNYLKSNFNWKMDTCIDVVQGKFVLKDDFYSNYVGTIFRPGEIVISRTPSLEEYILQLQFIFLRFQLAEIVVDTDFPKLVSAIVSAINVLKVKSPTIFMCYVPSKKDFDSELRNIQSLLDSVTEKGFHEFKELPGVHVELEITKFYLNATLIYNIKNRDLVLRMLKLTKQVNLNAGFSTDLITCWEMIKNTSLAKGSLNDVLLKEANYIICSDPGFLLDSRKIYDSGLNLDPYLFTRRLASFLFPNLAVHFRLNLPLKINSDRNDMTKLLSLVDLINKFGKAYNISFFFVKAFDTQVTGQETGWWGINNFSDLNDPSSYVEKLFVYSGQAMWYPSSSDTPLRTSTSNISTVTNILFASFALIFVLIAGVFIVVIRYRKLRQMLSDEEVQEFLNGKAQTEIELKEMGNVDYIKFNPTHNLKLSEMVIYSTKILGQGAFGTVYKGMVKEDEAAIKQPNRDCSKQTFMNVLAEVKVLSYIGSHPNVVEFYGAYTKEIHNGILHIATAFCSNGCLESFLRKKNLVICDQEANTNDLDETSVYILDLNRFALEIAKGMEYIEGKHIVHGDLASRNVLLNENFVCKIGDFGLSRKLYEYQKYVKTSQEPLPWKWMAYESLTKMEFTHKSDVWSYGVTLWEIYSLGETPYAGLNWSVEFPDELRNGLRPRIPRFSCQEIYGKMHECWNLNVAERPAFTELFEFFQGLSDEVYSNLQPLE